MLDDSELVTEFLILKLENTYKIRHLRFRGRACITNLPSNTAFRGFGFPQGTLIRESCITAVAAKCGLLSEKKPHLIYCPLNPLAPKFNREDQQIREKNMYKIVDKTIYKQAFSPETLIRCWNECLDKSSFHNRRMQVEEFNKKNYWKKKGMAIIPMKFSIGFAATSYHQRVTFPRHQAPPSPSTWEKCKNSPEQHPHLQARSTQCSRKNVSVSENGISKPATSMAARTQQ
ncbi:hypothetical protein GH733_008526 [Mirounga leonina]|nr:hypothetical protein GH733_008526 [Mirounga leonina]